MESITKPSRWVAHVDMDAFFCSVEVLDDPSLLGKPVIVGADPQEGKGRGVVAAASYEARKYGVHSAMPISQAWKLCPQGVYLHGRHHRYQELSDHVMDVLSRFTPTLEQISVDEAFLDLTGMEKIFGPPEVCGAKIKSAVKGETGLTCSVGMAAVKFLSKIASDFRKPDGLVIIPAGEEVAFLHPLKIEKLWGVGDKSAERLHSLGIHTIGELATWSQEALARQLGPAAASHLLELAWGRDPRVVHTDHDTKSVSHETTYDEDVTDAQTVEETLRILADQVSHRLIRHGWLARRVQLKYRTSDFKTLTRRTTLSQPTQNSLLLGDTAVGLFRGVHQDGAAVRLVGVGSSGLEEVQAEQLDLFGTPRESPVDKLVVDIQEKFGRDIIRRGHIHKKPRR